MRINKFLSECGIASRRKSEELIEEGRIYLNGKAVKSFNIIINPDIDKVEVDGEIVRPEKKVYFLLNKPKGYITSTNDEKKRKTVVDLIKTDKKIFPVGRLDYDTTGVLILTNDGEFANFFTHPKNRVTREYLAGIDKPLTREHRERLTKGIILDKRRSFFTKVHYPKKNNYKQVALEVVEGRNHFVKRMFNALGYDVKTLERINFGGVTAKDVPKGKYRKLSYTEVQRLMKENA